MKYFVLILSIFLLDQIIKLLSLKGFFPIVKNPTSFLFGYLPSFGFLTLSLYVTSTCFLLYWVLKKRETRRLLILSLFLAGGLSNSLDRIFRGFVIDYLPVLGFTVINLADLAIVASLSLLSYHIIIDKNQKSKLELKDLRFLE